MDYSGKDNNIQGQMPGQGMPMNGTPMQGRMPGQGIPGQGMPMNGAPMQGRMPGQGMPGQGMPMNGAPMQGRMSGQGMPGQGMPMNGVPMQGAPANRAPMQGGVNSGRNLRTSADEAGSKPAPGLENNINGKARLFDGDGKRASGSSFAAQGFMTGLAGFSVYIYAGILVLCLVIALIVYGSSHKGTGGKKYSIPTDMVTYTGVFRNIYEKASSGSLGGSTASAGVLYDDDGTVVPAAPTAVGEVPGAGTDSTANGDTVSSSDGSTSGATMELDSGEGTSGYSQAESYNELLNQVESAIAAGDTDFIGRKFAYEDEDGNLKGYPQSVVDHFVTYMSTNSDKRDSLMMELSNDKYQGQNEDAFVVKFPYIKFVVNMGYDDTTISLPGFADQVVNAGQSADIAPLLPCMYTLTISNPEWSEPVTRDIEANVNEATISINIKP